MAIPFVKQSLQKAQTIVHLISPKTHKYLI